MQKLPKKIRRQIRDLEGIAYERELENELHKLAAHFDDIAYAIKTGILKENEIPDEVWPHLEGPLDFYRDSDEESNNKSFSDT
ncbi:MAG: hypothetical protein P8X95_17645 [Anaerolineales bacterium]